MSSGIMLCPYNAEYGLLWRAMKRNCHFVPSWAEYFPWKLLLPLCLCPACSSWRVWRHRPAHPWRTCRRCRRPWNRSWSSSAPTNWSTQRLSRRWCCPPKRVSGVQTWWIYGVSHLDAVTISWAISKVHTTWIAYDWFQAWCRACSQAVCSGLFTEQSCKKAAASLNG